jgi:hypothetical protein
MAKELIKIGAEEIRIYASHRQFYVQDSEPRGIPGDDTFWTTAASDNRLAITDGIVGIGTGSYANVMVKVEVTTAKPPLEISDWDHVTEAGLDLHTKLLMIEGCISSSGLYFRVEPGHYRVRCCAANLAAAVDCGDGAGDSYFVQVWPSRRAPPRVLKRWLGESAEEHLAAIDPALQGILRDELAAGNEIVHVYRYGAEPQTLVVFSRPFRRRTRKLPAGVQFRRETDPMSQYESLFVCAACSLACRHGDSS